VIRVIGLLRLEHSDDVPESCAISDLICPLLFYGAFIAAGFVPPPTPSLSPAEVVAHYRDHAPGILLGAAIMLLSLAFHACFTAVISAQMRRIRGLHDAVVNTQTIAGAFGCLTFPGAGNVLRGHGIPTGAPGRVDASAQRSSSRRAFFKDGPFAWNGIFARRLGHTRSPSLTGGLNLSSNDG
jgi:hypothetical protein